MTVEEILKATGLSDEQIKAIDAKAVEGFNKVLTTAAQEKEAAELAKRAQADQYDKEIAPALDKWANDSTNLTAERDYYKTLAEKAKEGGFVPSETPPFKPAAAAVPGRDEAGKFVAGANPVPGSPQYMTKDEGYRAVSAAQWYVSEYMRLHNGAPPPVDMEVIAAEASRDRIPFRDYVEKKFEFGKKREEIKAAEQKKHDDAIRAEVAQQKDKEWSEKIGSNPAIRVAETSRFSEISTAVKSGQRADPLKMTPQERHAATSTAIQKEIATNSTVQ